MRSIIQSFNKARATHRVAVYRGGIFASAFVLALFSVSAYVQIDQAQPSSSVELGLAEESAFSEYEAVAIPASGGSQSGYTSSYTGSYTSSYPPTCSLTIADANGNGLAEIGETISITYTNWAAGNYSPMTRDAWSQADDWLGQETIPLTIASGLTVSPQTVEDIITNAALVDGRVMYRVRSSSGSECAVTVVVAADPAVPTCNSFTVNGSSLQASVANGDAFNLAWDVNPGTAGIDNVVVKDGSGTVLLSNLPADSNGTALTIADNLTTSLYVEASGGGGTIACPAVPVRTAPPTCRLEVSDANGDGLAQLNEILTLTYTNLESAPTGGFNSIWAGAGQEIVLGAFWFVGWTMGVPGFSSQDFTTSVTNPDHLDGDINFSAGFIPGCYASIPGENAPQPDPAPVCDSFTVTPANRTGSGSVTLDWETSEATSVSINQGVGSVSVDGSTTVTVSESTEFTLTASGPGGNTSCQATVTVTTPPPVATIEICNDTTSTCSASGSGWTGSNITVDATDQIRLRWSSTDADTCSGSGFSTSGNLNSAQTGIGATTPTAGANSTFTVLCTNSAGNDSDSVQVTANVPANITLIATPPIVRFSESTTLTWDLDGSDPATCTITGPGVNLTNLTGLLNHSVNIFAQSTFTLTCPTDSDTATVEVLPIIQET